MNEVIVGELGLMLGAPVRPRVLIAIPPEVTQWEEFPVRASGNTLLGHASLHVGSAVDDDDLRYTKRDDNARRQAAIIGLWDLCIGEDPQWLYETAAAYSMWSYDHGLWFTTGEGDWDSGVLEGLVDLDGTPRQIPGGLDRERLLQMADAIESLTPEALLYVVSAVPVEWGTSDRDLAAMAWFLYRRRGGVAARLRIRAGEISTGPSA